jgi:hypothetical protein
MIAMPSKSLRPQMKLHFMANCGDNIFVNPMPTALRPNRAIAYRARTPISFALYFAALLLGTTCALAAEFIPATRRVPWIPGVTVGVPGGIPARTTLINVTQAPYNADNTGATNAQPAIQAAIGAAAENSVVYLPAGTYRMGSAIGFGQGWTGKNNITVRGAGMGQTILVGNYTGNGMIYVTNTDSAAAASAITAGLAKGSATITIADTSAYGVGQPATITAANDPDLPVFSIRGYSNLRGQKVRIVSKTATTLTFSPALYESYGGGARAVTVSPVGQNGFYARGIGIEDLTIDLTNVPTPVGGAGSGIVFDNAHRSWVKNVRIKKATNYPLNLNNCSELEVRGCWVDSLKTPNGTNRAGILVNHVSASLFEDNIIVEQQPNIEVNFLSSGNAFSRNYCSSNSFGIDTNHAPHPQFNLYEGNVALGLFIADGYFGSCSDDTVFRNKFNATVSFKRFTRRYNVACNYLFDGFQLGKPYIGNNNHNGEANYPSDPWQDFENATTPYLVATLTGRTANDAGTLTMATKVGSLSTGWQWVDVVWDGGAALGFQAGTVSGLTVPIGPYIVQGSLPAVGTAVRVYTGPGGYGELDLGVAATMIEGGNRRTDNNSVSALSGDVPSSYLYGETKPQWIIDAETQLGRSFTLKGFAPETTATHTNEDIPAGYRFANPSAPTVLNNAAPTNVRIVRQ